MSLKALVEVLVHLDTFRNIDLFYQGLYYARFKIYYAKPAHAAEPLGTERDDREPEAHFELVQPYWNFQTQRQDDRTLKMKPHPTDPHNLLSSSITDDQSAFLTKAFLIRYCEEEVELNDIVMFRAELDVEPDYLQTEFFLECELFFCDLSNLGGPTGWKNNFKRYQSEAKFKPV